MFVEYLKVFHLQKKLSLGKRVVNRKFKCYTVTYFCLTVLQKCCNMKFSMLISSIMLMIIFESD